jgi:ATP-binding cassette subfamily F protein 3
MLGKIIATPSNLLLLDEPTNHLDMQSIDALCEAIEKFEGSTIMVTHSEMLLRRLADGLIIFHKGGAEYFDGNYDEFLEKIGWEEEGVEKPTKTKTDNQDNKSYSKEYKKKRASLIQEKSKKAKGFKKTISSCEEKIITLEKSLEEENDILQKASNEGNNPLMIETSQNIEKLNKEIEEQFEKLEISSDKLQLVEEKYDTMLEELEKSA